MRRPPGRMALLVGPLTLAAAGCGQGALDPAGDDADRVATLFWVMLALSIVPMLAVTALIAGALIRRARRRPLGGWSARLTDHRLIIAGGVILPALLLVPTIAMTLNASRAEGGEDASALEIEMTAHRFWWDLRYPAPGADRLDQPGAFRTANEIHIPVGRPVVLRLLSNDVIHSFWIPRLGGKTDLIPGRTNTHRLTAREPGVYRGQCAEFCGTSHALMKLVVVAHPEDEFERWRRREAAPVAVEPEPGLRQQLANSCGPCHDMRGVFESETFRGDVGPDLTHLASRRMIAGNLLPNTREGLGRWIIDPQGVKPDNYMPDVGLDAEALADVVDYLEQLR